MTEGFPLVKINGKGLTEPATALINKISDAVGGLYKPYQIRRVAKAEADAEIIREHAKIEITEIQRRALNRFVIEEAKKQNNIESITEKAISHLNASATPQDIEDDWIVNFFDKCRIISDEEMQILWSKVLAGESNSPGAFSRRTVNILGSIDKHDAHLFTRLCGFALETSSDRILLVYDTDSSIYNNQEINYRALTHLDDIGLVSFNHVTGFKLRQLPKKIFFNYYGDNIILEFQNPDGNNFEIGTVFLTNVGDDLSRICGSKPVDGFLDYLIERWSKQGLIISSK